jgi:TRAP-type C4-dicarboxylate transport system permease small subunit
MSEQNSDPEAAGLLGIADRAMRPFEDTINMFAALAIFVLMLLGSAQILFRTVFNSPIAGYIDLVELSMASMAFLGAAYCQRLGAHIRMDILIGRFRGRALWGFEVFGTLVALFIIGVLIWHGWGHFLRSYTLGDSTIDAEFPVWPSKLLVPIAFGFWFIRLTIQLIGSIRLFIDPSKTPVGVTVIQGAAEQAADEIHETFGDDVPENVQSGQGEKQ